VKQVLIAIDQLANTLFGGFADETLSARCWREQRTMAIRIIDTQFFFDPNHCENSWRSEVLRLQLPKGYRE
jgi:hypothetical protein